MIQKLLSTPMGVDYVVIGLDMEVQPVHAVQSFNLKFTRVVQIRCTSGQVRVQNLCKQIED